MNETSAIALAASATIVAVAVHECVSAFENPYTSANRPPDPSTTPGRSSLGRCGCGWLTSRRRASSASGTTMIRFTYRHQRQDSACVSAPPNKSPTVAPEAAIALKMPNALGLSGEPANVIVKSPSADGARKAPKTPCSARAATSIVNDCARPPIADAIANPARPAMNVYLRPNRSPSLPPNRSRLPNASAYAVMIHWRLSVEK